MRRNLQALTLLTLLASGAAQANSSATLDIVTTIAGGTCMVSVSNGGLIVLDAVQTNALDNIQPEDNAPGGAPFTLTVDSCDVDTQQPGDGTLHIAFTPQSGAFVGDTLQVFPSTLAAAQNCAENIGFVVFTDPPQGNGVNVQKPGGAGSRVEQQVSKAELLHSRYPFYVRYQKITASAPVQAGLLFSQALIEVSYD